MDTSNTQIPLPGSFHGHLQYQSCTGEASSCAQVSKKGPKTLSGKRALGHSKNLKTEPGVLAHGTSALFLPSLEVSLHGTVRRTSHFLDSLAREFSSLLRREFPSWRPPCSRCEDPGMTASGMQRCERACYWHSAMSLVRDLHLLEVYECMALLFF